MCHGSANDAEDHGYKEDAGRMRCEFREAIRDLLSKNAFLMDAFPTLQNEPDTLSFLDFDWAGFSMKADELLELLCSED